MSKQRRIKRAEKREGSKPINYAQTIAALKQSAAAALRNKLTFERLAARAAELAKTHPFIIVLGDPKFGATGAPVKSKDGRLVAGISYKRTASQFTAEGVDLFKRSKFTNDKGEEVEVQAVEAAEYYKGRAEREAEALKALNSNIEAAVELKRRQGAELVETPEHAQDLQSLASESRVDIYVEGKKFDRRRSLAKALTFRNGREVRAYVYQRDIYLFTQPIKKR